jgi:phospholipase C
MSNFIQRFSGLALIATSLLAGCNYGDPASGGGWPYGQAFDRVVIIVLENSTYANAMADPYLSSLASQGLLLTNYHGATHNSYPNYLNMVTGHNYTGAYPQTTLDVQINVDDASVADLLEAKGLSWKSYAEDYPGGCYLDSDSSSDPDYARKHVPLLSFTRITGSPSRCANIVNAQQFAQDWAAHSLPSYSFYTPNLNDDGHNSSLQTASAWLQGFLEPLRADSAGMAGTLFVITFDESSDLLDSNQVYSVLVGPMIQPGSTDATLYNHTSLLSTIEANFNLGNLGNDDAEASPILGGWK